MRDQTVLISGASVAGPALAYWLRRYGYAVTVVERASALRAGGQAIDFKGRTPTATSSAQGCAHICKKPPPHPRRIPLPQHASRP
ncbi:hypothetical protein AWN90_00810 [Nocardia terpenica]|uniref:FAD-binding domain-containing protein n=1 Tax=Nocardia terpenica TaxID=455432 RepID=A0A164KFR3_9NOCA|nr:hypothetical protein AWN90_00810 [Nocardia terpenica]